MPASSAEKDRSRFSQLDQFLVRPHPVEAQLGVDPAGHHQLQRRGPVLQQQRQGFRAARPPVR